ncbi:MAG: CDP-alcohol phosphatidyltransferase family protein [Chlamydiia bacterium]
MKKPYVVPNIITALGLSIGLFVIFKTAMFDPSLEAKTLLLRSALLIMLAACVDVLDGFVARCLKGESLFGMNFDSLSDAITFGVAPSVLFIKTFATEPGTISYFAIFLAAMLFSLCGVLRLVRFNVSSLDEEDSKRKKIYTGLPIPAAALSAISIQLILVSSPIKEFISVPVMGVIGAVAMILLSYLMISLKRFASLKVIQKKVLDFKAIFFISLFMLTLSFGLMYYFEWVFFLVTWTYVIGGVVKGASNSTIYGIEEE